VHGGLRYLATGDVGVARESARERHLLMTRIAPHLVRPLTSRMPSRLLLPAGLGGAALLLTADIAVRVILPAGELNVGVLTALIGAPFFLWLVVRSRREAF
jgi:iron complex transport system permease protein